MYNSDRLNIKVILMAKKRKAPKTKMPKVTKLSQKQMDDFLKEIMGSNISEESIDFARMLIHGNAWIAQQLELWPINHSQTTQTFSNTG